MPPLRSCRCRLQALIAIVPSTQLHVAAAERTASDRKCCNANEYRPGEPAEARLSCQRRIDGAGWNERGQYGDARLNEARGDERRTECQEGAEAVCLSAAAECREADRERERPKQRCRCQCTRRLNDAGSTG